MKCNNYIIKLSNRFEKIIKKYATEEAEAEGLTQESIDKLNKFKDGPSELRNLKSTINDLFYGKILDNIDDFILKMPSYWENSKDAFNNALILLSQENVKPLTDEEYKAICDRLTSIYNLIDSLSEELESSLKEHLVNFNIDFIETSGEVKNIIINNFSVNEIITSPKLQLFFPSLIFVYDEITKKYSNILSQKIDEYKNFDKQKDLDKRRLQIYDHNLMPNIYNYCNKKVVNVNFDSLLDNSIRHHIDSTLTNFNRKIKDKIFTNLSLTVPDGENIDYNTRAWMLLTRFEGSNKFKDLAQLDRFNRLIDILISKKINLNDPEIKLKLVKIFLSSNFDKSYVLTNEDIFSEFLNRLKKYNSPTDIIKLIDSIPYFSYEGEDTYFSFSLKEEGIKEAKEYLLLSLSNNNFETKVTRDLLRSITPFIACKILTIKYNNSISFIMNLLFRSLKGKDANFIIRVLESIDLNFIINISEEQEPYNEILSFYIKEGDFSTNEKFLKIVKDIHKCFKITHQIGVSDEDRKDLIDNMFKYKINISHDFIKKIVSVIYSKEYNKIIESIKDIKDDENHLIFKFCKKNNININELTNKFNNFSYLFKNGKIIDRKQLNEDQYTDLLRIDSQLKLLSIKDAIEEYGNKAEPKNKILFKLNYKINDDLYFKVLEDLDPNYFTIGAETDCCQRIGGAGEGAAIDSFINSLAGVLVLYYKNNVVAQSYFHYVPEDNGIILDNVEANDKNVKLLLSEKNLRIDDCYAALAKQAQQDLNLSYFRCGLGYNKLNDSLFEASSLSKDKRRFQHSDKYTDFSAKNNLDLLKPNFESEISLTKIAMSNYRRLVSVINSFNRFIKIS